MGEKSEEIEIKVPWGHIAAKTWGKCDDPLVLVFHGLLDNAASFNRLIPYLPTAFYYVCCDLPGHGRSSHFPAFFPLHAIDYVIVYKLIALHFKKEKYIIMGHSLGGQIGYFFAQLYPQFVEKLILLDIIHAMPVPVENFHHHVTEMFDFCIHIHENQFKRERPIYTYQEALDKLQNQRFDGYVTREAAEALRERAIAPAAEASGKFYFTADERLKHLMSPLHDFKYIIETIEKYPVKIPILIVFGNESQLHHIYMQPVLKKLEEYKNVIVKYVDGHHDVHNNNPERVAPIVNKFLLGKQAKL